VFFTPDPIPADTGKKNGRLLLITSLCYRKMACKIVRSKEKKKRKAVLIIPTWKKKRDSPYLHDHL